MADHHEEEQLGKLYDGRAARRLIRYLGPYKRTVGVALVLTVGLNLTRQVGPLLTKWAIDDYVKPASESAMGLGRAFHGITILSLVYIRRWPSRSASDIFKTCCSTLLGSA